MAIRQVSCKNSRPERNPSGFLLKRQTESVTQKHSLMKTGSLVAIILLALGLMNLPAKDLKFPEEGKTLFTITIPDSWEPEFDDDGTLEANEKDGHSYLAIWDEDTNELATVVKNIDEVLTSYAKDVKLTADPAGIEVEGLKGLLLKGEAKDSEDGRLIGFNAVILEVSPKSAIVIYFDYGKDAPDSVKQGIEGILKSFKPVKG